MQSKVNKVEREADKTIEKVNKVLDKLPDAEVDRFVKEWKALDKVMSKSMEMTL